MAVAKLHAQGSRSTNQKRVRALLLAALKRDVAELVKRDAYHALEDTLNNAGYLSNWSTHTSRDLGRVIVMVAPMLDVDDLADVVSTAAYSRARGELDDVENAHLLAERISNATLERCSRDVFDRFLARINATFAA